MRRSFLIVALIVLAGVVGLGVWFAKPRKTAVEAPIAPESVQTEQVGKAPEMPASPAPQQQPSPAPTPVPVPSRPEPSAETRQLVAALTQFKGPINAEQAALWKTNL